MAANDSRAKIIARIWQSIAQSGVQVSSIPKEQLDALVGAVADGVLLALKDISRDAGLPQRNDDGPLPSAASASPERSLWKGRPFLSLIESYEVTSERVIINKGLFSRDFEDIELIRMQDIDFTQGLGGRIINRGTLILRSADVSDPVVKLRKVASPHKVHEVIRRAMLEARQRYGIRFQEEITVPHGR